MSKGSGISRLLSALWSTINFTRKLFLNILFFGLLIIVLIAVTKDKETFVLTEPSALVLNLSGQLVEEKTFINPVDAVMQESLGGDNQQAEISIHDINKVLEAAAEDDNIQIVVLELQNLIGGGLNKLDSIGERLNAIKANGKTVIASGDYYTRSQYYLASYADKVVMNPMGFVQLDGFSAYNTYFKDALDKLKVSTYIFRVGTYKSFVEPFMRNDMSDEAKTANRAWLTDLWRYYKNQVAERRNIPTSNFDEQLTIFMEKFAEANYDHAQYALNNQWVDELATREQVKKMVAEKVGWSDSKRSYRHVEFNQYLNLVNQSQFNLNQDQKVAVVVARGTIYDGERRAGEIGGDSTARLLERARLDDSVKAVVLRIDSPGGSAFASEVIRREIDLLKAANKPVVASMSSTAASGGYWIAASADQIWAHPTSITGSIGVFGLAMTFENSFKEIGINADGVKTTEWPVMHPAVPLSEQTQKILQKSTEAVYQKFVSLVANNRNMAFQKAEQAAQGRVWSGAQAQKLGLVDELGSFDDAVHSAAQLADIQDYSVHFVQHELSQQEVFIKNLLQSADAYLDFNLFSQPQLPTELVKLYQQIKQINAWNDPQGLYALCIECP
ncbi:signal peptide peptidase SppA [Gayadomonas joobiniege]|uniref:signal peptide peptidase SppA n=1 Tax=Gayadomonas joobiniege TaxID=1234606 RepID=UPI0003615613|nr:signal peptide peptidase SppA [Gayadomonas joobiniege]